MNKAEAQALGLENVIAITSEIRHGNCDARSAELASVEGKVGQRIAIYKGTCASRHHYQVQIKEKAKEKEKVVEKTITLGGEGFDAGKHKLAEL